MAELVSITYEQARAEHFESLMKKMQRKIDYWQYRGQYSHRPKGELSRANIECSEAGMQYNFYKDALEALEDNKFQYETGFVKGFEAAQTKWISVEDRLPDVVAESNFDKRTEYVLAMCEGGVFYVGRFYIYKYDESFEFASGYERFEVTHWKPLPEPPKEE